MPLNEVLVLAGALLGAGILTGLLAGIFGVGGGAVIVPVLYEVFRLLDVAEEVRMPLCVGTSLAVIIPTSIRSFRSHLARGVVDMAVLRLWIAPVTMGVIAGVIIAADAPAWLFKGVFAVVAGMMAFKLLFARANWTLGDTLPGKGLMQIYGLVIGAASALMGIGGGAISNLLFSLYRMPIHQAVATSSGLGVIISIPAMIGYVIGGLDKSAMVPPLSLGYVSLIGAALIIPTSMLAAPWGVRVAHALSQRKLELALGFYLAIVSIRFSLSLLG